MKPKTTYTLIGVYLLTLMWSPPSSAGMSSPSFWVPAQVLDSGGSQGSSKSFRHLGAIGQPTPIGFSKSKSFSNQAGFIPQILFQSLSEGCIEEDLNKDGDITPSDALIAFRCYLQSGPCSDCADVNKDGDFTPGDAFCLFQKYLGNSSCLD